MLFELALEGSIGLDGKTKYFACPLGGYDIEFSCRTD